MAVFIVLWSCLFTTKLRSVIRHILEHSKPSLPLRHTTTIPSQAKDSTGPERAAQAAEKTEAERKKRRDYVIQN